MTVYAVAMSGGVDSSTTAAILKSQGHEVFGITMLTSKKNNGIITDAKKTADILGIKHYVYDVSDQFQAYVIDYFINSYNQGLTPNPCAICNRDIKLNLLLKFAKEQGADLLATGHYANMEVIDDQVFLKESTNKLKDQSYFLSLTPKENLKYVRFPLGEIPDKKYTRELAQNFGLGNFNKSDSQDICFIPNGDYIAFIKEHNNSEKPGDIILNGKIIGRHNGITNYTVGQRRGLNISYKEPLYVTNIKDNQIYLGPRSDLIVEKFIVKNMNWLINIENNFECKVKIRSGKTKFKARIFIINQDKIEVTLLEPNNLAICPGQVCAIYDSKNIVRAAGEIE